MQLFRISILISIIHIISFERSEHFGEVAIPQTHTHYSTTHDQFNPHLDYILIIISCCCVSSHLLKQ